MNMKSYAVALALTMCLTTAAMGSAVRPSHDTNFEDFHAWMDKAMTQFQPSGRALGSDSLKDCNVNLCWAFDGSGSIDKASFKSEKTFANKVGSVINFGLTPSKMSAVQYATNVRPVQRLTKDDALFLTRIDAMKQMRGLTNVDGGIFGCRFLLDSAQGEARHIIIMTDGAATIGAPGIAQAAYFRSKGGLVSIVAAGNPDQDALDKLAGPSGKVYNVNSFTDDIEMAKISIDLGTRVCSLSEAS